MIVVDTNVLSEVMRPAPDPAPVQWLDAQSADTLYLSSVTVAELLYGVGVMPQGARKSRNDQLIDALMSMFAGRVLAFDHEAARRFSEMAIAGKAAGRPLSREDGYIAATAAANGFAVATRNIKDFTNTGVSVINPWSA